MPDYHLAKLTADQPCLWLPLALPAYQLVRGATTGATSTFEVSRFEGESNEAQIETLSLVHPDESAATTETLAQAPRDELLQVAAAVVITSFLRVATGQRLRRVSRGEGGLWFYLDQPGADDDCLLLVVAANDDDVHRALGRATEQVEYAPCARRIAAAVAFSSGKAALRVLS